MPATLSYPGVYVEELPSGVRTITGVATSITAFIGRTRKGKENEPVVINSFADYERKFGGLWGDSTVSFAVRDFYLNGGSQAIIVRLFTPLFVSDAARLSAFTDARGKAKDAANQVAQAARNKAPAGPPALPAAGMADAAGVLAAARDKAATYGVPVGATEPEKQAISIAMKSVVDAAAVALLSAKTPQQLADAANVFAEATFAAPADANKLAGARAVVQAARTAAGAPNASPLNVLGAAVGAVPAAGDPKVGGEAVANEIVRLINEDTKMVAAAAENMALEANAPTAAAIRVAPIAKAKLDLGVLKLEAANPGAWGNGLRVRVDNDIDVSKPNKEDLFNLTVQLTEGSSKQTEIFRNVSWRTTDARSVKTVLENESTLIRLQDGLNVTGRPADHPNPATGKDVFDASESSSTGVAVADSASDGIDPSSADYIGSAGDKTGINALEKADLFNLLCIPPVAHTADVNIDVDNSVWTKAAEFCDKKRAMLIVDSPDGWNKKEDATTKIVAFRSAATTSKNAALFFPRLLQPNPLKKNQKERFASCGAVAGVFARTDTQRGVWKAPAGLDATLVGVPELSVSLTDLENGELNPLGVNCLRNMPAAGNVVWGARTMEGDDRRASEWKYIPVRRTALFIEETLYRNTQWVVFEPNDEPLWAQIRLNIGAFMHSLFRQGAFQGATPREAYFVKCDKETTTQNDINNGIVNIIVGFAPLKPAEFVVIKLQQIAGQIQV